MTPALLNLARLPPSLVRLPPSTGGGIRTPVPVIFVAGESNAVVLNATTVPSSLQAAMPDVQIWQPWNNVFANYLAGTNSDALFSDPPVVASARTPGTAGFGPEAQIGKLWTRDQPGEKIYIIKVAKSSAALQPAARQPLVDPVIAIWDENADNELFEALLNAKTAAFAYLRANGMEPDIKGAFWMQGVNDASQAATYLAAVRAFAAAFRTQIMDGSTAPFIFGRIAAAQNATIRAAQVTAGGDTSCKWISTDAYALQGDNVHYLNTSVPVMGADIYRALFPNATGAFSDSFGTAMEMLEYDDNWTRIDGSIGAVAISGGVITGTSSDTAGATYSAPDPGSVNHFVEGKVAAASINALCCRLQNRDNYLGVHTHNGTTGEIRVLQKVAGTTTVLMSTGITPVLGDVLRLEASGSNFTLKRNGVQVGSPTAFNAALTSAKVGVIERNISAICDEFASGAL